MKEIFHKLTHSSASRYDRGRVMAEGNTQLLDREVNPDVREFWKERIAREPDPNARSVMQAMMKRNFVPQGEKVGGESLEETANRVEQMTQEEMQQEYEKLKGEVKGKEREAFTEEKDIDKYIKRMKEELQGKSVAPGRVVERRAGDWEEKESKAESIENIKADWSEYKEGWDNEGIKQIARQLNQVGMDLDFNQIRTLLEMLLATGRRPEELLPRINRESFDQTIESEIMKDYAKIYRFSRAEDVQKLAYLETLGLDKDDYLRRFVFYNDFRQENEREYDEYPANIEELAWQIIHSPEGTHDKYGINGETPLLEMRFDKESNKGKYYVNQANMTLWIRDRMMYAYNLDPDAPLNFFESVKITKRWPISLGSIFGSPGNYFKSEDENTVYDELYNEWIKEAWAIQTLRSWDAKYRQVMGDPKARLEFLQQIFVENTLTKRAWNKNLFNLVNTLSLEFKGPEKGELIESDSILGAAANEIYLAYDALSDFDRLREILGEGSSFFTKDGWMEIFKEKVAKEKVATTGEEQVRAFLGSDLSKAFNGAFDENGRIATADQRDKFVKFVNHIWQVKIRNPNLELATREALKMAVAEKYGSPVDKDGNEVRQGSPEFKEYAFVTSSGKKDKHSLDMAEVIAFSMVRVMGAAARNDTTAAGYDFFTKMHYFETYRTKQIKNGVGGGSPYSVKLFKTIAVDPFRGMVTLAERDTGRVDKKGNPIFEHKTPIEVMDEMQKLRTGYNIGLKRLERELSQMPEADKAAIDAKRAEIREFKSEMAQAYQDKTGELEFRQTALQNYWDDHLMRAQEVYNMILGADEFDFEEFVAYDTFGGVRFDREKFQEKVQSGFLHHVRYFLNTYPDLNYNSVVRALDQSATARLREENPDAAPIFRDMPLGEAMFGHEVLNRPAFWKRDENGRPINMVDARGRKVKGLYEIDYDKLNTKEGKLLLVKQWFMTKIAADLHSHRDIHSTDPRYDINYYTSILSALEAIPSVIGSDEHSITDQVVLERFLSKKDMKWLKKSIKIENFNLFVRAIAKDFLLPEEEKSGLSLFFLPLIIASREIIRREGA
jgi:hypothetical protein